MLNRTIRLGISACIVALSASSATAERFLTPDQMIVALADGAPWIMKRNDGIQANLTLRRDGTGFFEGPFKGPSAWNVSGDDICMMIKTPMPASKLKCFRLTKMSSGYQAYEDGAPVFTLKR